MALAATLVAGGAAIDDFAVNQAPLATGAAAVAGGMLGGEREFRLETGSGTRGIAVNLGQLAVSHDAGATGNITVVWDGAGDDAATTQAAGLGAVDLTAAGTKNAFLLGLDSAQRAFEVTLTVRSAGGSSSATVNIAASGAPSAIRVPFASFAGAASFSAIGAIELAISPTAQANSVELDYLTTASTADALPLVAQLTDVVLVDADGDGHPSAGDTLRYTLTVRNTGATPLSNVVFQFPSVGSGADIGEMRATPVAQADGPTANSAPGDTFHAAYEAVAFSNGNLTMNDFRGWTFATVTSFGGGTLGGTAATHGVGTSATNDGHTLQVNANGTFSYTAKPGFVGYFTFDYTIANPSGASTATATIAVGVRPGAGADSYEVTGNTALSGRLIGAAGSVGVNDVGTNATFAVAGAPAHGTLAIDASTGHIDYTPVAGYTGSDNFTYTISNGLGSATGTATLTVANALWYIDAAAVAGGDGRSTSPFRTIADFNSANTGAPGRPGNGATILLRSGNYTGAMVLSSGQKLYGDGTTVPLAVALGFALAPGSAKALGASPVAVPGFSGNAPVLTSSSHGVVLNSGNTVRGIRVDATTNFGFFGSAVGALTISECSKTGPGQAVNLANGALTVTLTSASSTNGSNGIVLSNTTGAFAVTGTGTAGSGGGITGASGNGITLSTATNVSLAWMNIYNNQGSGISGTGVSGLSLDHCTFDTNGDASTTDGTEANLWGSNITGTLTLANCTIQNASDANIRLTASTGSLTLGLTNTTVQNSQNHLNGHGFLWTGTGTSAATITATGCVFAGNDGQGFGVNSVGTSHASVTVSGCTFAGNGTGLLFETGGAATQRFWVTGSPSIIDSKGVAIGVIAGTDTTTACQIDGTIENNTIGDGTADSGSSDDYGIAVDLRSVQSARLAIRNNVVRNTDKAGLWVSTANFGAPLGGSLDLTMIGNTIGTPDDNSAFPYGTVYTALIESRHSSTLTATISGNTIAAGKGGVEALRVRQRDTSATNGPSLLRLQQYVTPGTLSEANVIAAAKTGLASANPAVASIDVTVADHTRLLTGFPVLPTLP
ncbi:MAG: Ig-like domain-containing protein [Opitutaceae bacterium]